jgi:3-phosphoinositide dependent protein kinase-1
MEAEEAQPEENKLNEEDQDEFQDKSTFSDRKGTFVGTAYYVSPEMLSDNRCFPSSDLWALGCIIYRMLTGEYPFAGPNDYMTFQLILERTLVFPTDLSPDAKDLIGKLI